MNNTIGFTNFRRFQIFPEKELGEITILVGGNNAGKSTLVKAMLLMRDFLKSRIEKKDNSKNNKLFEPNFSFDTEHVNIGEFYRAFCRQSPRKEDTISFTMKIDKFRFIVYVRGERKSGIIPEVSMIAVSDEERDITFSFDFTKKLMTARFEHERKAMNDHYFKMREDLLKKEEDLTKKQNDLQKKLHISKDLETITAIKYEIEKTETELYRIHTIRKTNESNNFDADFDMTIFDSVSIDMHPLNDDNIGKLVIPELIKGFVAYADSGITGDKRSKIYRDEESNKTFLRGKASEINTIAEEIDAILNKQVIEYIYAHSVYQDSVYANCANSSDYTKRTIHEFYTSRISEGDEEFSFIEEWLKEFKIGTSLKVIPYKGDNYSFVIFDEDNPEITSEKKKGYPGGIDLADKGMGSIQVVILLLRIATLIRKYKGQELTILLEEPEQNLHPALQSKLAELVYRVNIDFGLRFIIETHSEYLIRKTQVIVAENNYIDESQLYNHNPFRVFYLPYFNDSLSDFDNTLPYEMVYTLSGRFANKFGEGFFDEAGKSNLITLRKEKELKK